MRRSSPQHVSRLVHGQIHCGCAKGSRLVIGCLNVWIQPRAPTFGSRTSVLQEFLKQRALRASHTSRTSGSLTGMFVIFVSHQWLGATHPDPRGKQLAVLRASLRGIIDGSLHIEGDLISLIKGRPRLELPNTTRKDVQNGFLFLDWFAIPQITARHEGVNEDLTRSHAALAVQSIPAYVEAWLGSILKCMGTKNT